MTPIPPNPWLTLGGIPSPRGADVPYSPVVAASAPSTNAAPDRSSSLPSGVIDPSVTADYAGAAAHVEELMLRGIEAGVDPALLSEAQAALEARMLSELTAEVRTLEVEPVPAFLTVDTRAEQIEELLEFARADEWPAPPMRRAVG
jgi:hypothetical protein